MNRDYEDDDPSLIHDPLGASQYPASPKQCGSGKQRPLERRCVDQLRRVAEACGAVIVLSTAWRLHAPKREFLFTALAPLRIVGCTPDLRAVGRDRGAEVTGTSPQPAVQSSFVLID